MDNKYNNGKIYTIRYKNDDSLIYVGSTVTPLYKRFSNHKTNSKNPKNDSKQQDDSKQQVYTHVLYMKSNRQT
jgi:hypothetical protein